MSHLVRYEIIAYTTFQSTQFEYGNWKVHLDFKNDRVRDYVNFIRRSEDLVSRMFRRSTAIDSKPTQPVAVAICSFVQ